MTSTVSTGTPVGLPSRFAPASHPVTTPMVQLVDEQGHEVTDPDFSLPRDPASVAALLTDMAMIRRFDVEATALQRKGQLGLWAPLLGQEAIQVGVAAALGEADHVFPSHREHGLGTLMGLDLARILGIFTGAEMGDWDAEQVRFHHYNMVIGAGTLHGVGYAMAQAKDADRDPAGGLGASVIFHGDGAISEGDVNEAYIFAAAYQSPAVFMCVNNQWAISEPVTRQSRVPLYQRAWGFGIPCVRVDGNDVLAVEAVTRWALDRAHSGEGPTLIEANTYRIGAHTTSDDPTKYRTQADSEPWARRDPITRIQNWLRSKGAWDDARQADLDQQLEAYGTTVRQTVERVGVPQFDDIFDRVYADQAINDSFDRVI